MIKKTNKCPWDIIIPPVARPDFEGYNIYDTDYFKPNIVNIICDASKSNNTSAISHDIIFTNNNMSLDVANPGVKFIEAKTTSEAELSAIVYGLINCNDIMSPENGIDTINIFTDSIYAIGEVFNGLSQLNFYKMHYNGNIDATAYNDIVKALNSDLALLFIEECYVTNKIVNLYHLKAHTTNMLYIINDFMSYNRKDLKLNDAIILSSWHAHVDLLVRDSIMNSNLI